MHFHASPKEIGLHTCNSNGGFGFFGVCVHPQLASSTLSAPAEVIRSRSMTLGQTFSECMAETWRTEGWTGFFKGWTAASARNIPVLLVQYQICEPHSKQRMQIVW